LSLALKLLEMLFGCRHENKSFPQTKRAGQRRTRVQAVTGTYVACLECGMEFAYDWQEMRIVQTSGKFMAERTEKGLTQ
jgi:hypothetical protein